LPHGSQPTLDSSTSSICGSCCLCGCNLSGVRSIVDEAEAVLARVSKLSGR